MPRTSDRVSGPSYEEKLVLETEDADGNPTVDPTEAGGITYHSGSFAMRDGVGVFDPRGISDADHKALRHLIHFVDEGPAGGFVSGAYKETLPAGDPFPTSAIWWESSSKIKKIVELTITRNANKTPATEVWKMYDTDGSTVLITMTDTITYSSIYETARTRTWT